MEQSASVLSLPIELWQHIGSYLTFKNFAKIALTCKRLRNLLRGIIWRNVCFARHYSALNDELLAFVKYNKEPRRTSLSGIGPDVRHACIIVLYDQPSTHDDGWGWVDAPGHLRRPLPPRELDFSELLFQAMDLMPQLEDLHLDIRHLGGHAMFRFERRCIRLIAQERRGLPRLRHLRCLGIGLDWRIIDWCLNLCSLDIDDQGWLMESMHQLRKLKSLRRLALTVDRDEPHELVTLSGRVIESICWAVPEIEWLILKTSKTKGPYEPHEPETFPQTLKSFVDKCQPLRKLQRLAVVVGWKAMCYAAETAGLQPRKRGWDGAVDRLVVRMVLPELERLPPSVVEFCILREWPLYYECKRRREDGSFSALFREVTDGRGPGTWPVGLLDESWNPGRYVVPVGVDHQDWVGWCKPGASGAELEEETEEEEEEEEEY